MSSPPLEKLVLVKANSVDGQDRNISRPSAILRLPLELREQIYYWALQDTLIPGPRHPYDDQTLPKRVPPLRERFLTLTFLRSVSRRLHAEVDQVFQRDIMPDIVFYFFCELPALSNLHRRFHTHPYLRHARFYLRSPDKETICANDDADNIWDTLIESQEGCAQVSYEEDPQVIAEWTVSSTPRNRAVQHHTLAECDCEGVEGQRGCLPYATIPYPPLAKSLRLKSCVWSDQRFANGKDVENMVVCSVLEGKFEDLNFDAFHRLATEKRKRMAEDFRSPAYWMLMQRAMLS